MKHGITLILVIYAVTLCATPVQPAGAGTQASPYQIASLANLEWMDTTPSSWNRWFVQTQDIDAIATEGWNDGEGWIPLGNSSNNFTGHYDGQGYSILALTVFRSSDGYQGFLGKASNATISNLRLPWVYVDGYYYTAILAGWFSGGSITNCYVDGGVFGDDYCGGLVGEVTGSAIISKSCSNAEVQGRNYSGGFVGKCSGSITNCYSLGVSWGQNYVGGLVGYNTGSISASYSSAYVTGSSYTGGLVGRNIGTDSQSFWNTEESQQASSAGGTGITTEQMRIRSTFTNAGWDFAGETTNGTGDYWRIDGYNNTGYPYLSWQPYPPVINTSFDQWLPNVDFGQAPTTDLVITNNTADTLMISGMNFLHGNRGFSTTFPAIPYMLMSDTSMTLSIAFNPAFPGCFTDSLIITSDAENCPVKNIVLNGSATTPSVQPSGEGSQSSPYQIASVYNLKWVDTHPTCWGAWFTQTADIDASETNYWNNGTGWTPLGSDETPFTGHYDGQQHIINGLYVNRADQPNQGLFGVLNGGSVSGLILLGAEVRGDTATGLLTGSCTSGTAGDCHVEGEVHGSTSVGGLIGHLTSGSVSECSSDAEVFGTSETGGLIGNSGGMITESLTKGTVSANNTSGGLVGLNTGNVENCYAHATVTGSSTLGGLVGSSTSGSIECCYSVGAISTGASNGGLIGNATDTTIGNCFWNTETSGFTTSGGGIGLTTMQMHTSTVFTAAGWDYATETANGTNDVWWQDGVNNNGYPYLTWESYNPDIVASDDELAFGGVYLRQTTGNTLPFAIRNTGNCALVLFNATLSDGTAGFSMINEPAWPYVVPQSDSLVITMVFNPDHVGNVSDQLIFSTNVIATSSLIIDLNGQGLNAAPTAPQNVLTQTEGVDMILNWDPVTTNIAGATIQPDGYIVLYSETADATTDDYLFHGFSTATTYTHQRVLRYSPRMFYKVLAVVEIDGVRLNEIITRSTENASISWRDMKMQMRR